MTQTPGPKVLVIGAGLGGISAAISLRAAGYEVEVHEKNDHVGGKLNRLQTEGFAFDLGPSILTLPHYFKHLFQMHDKRMSDYVSCRQLAPHWRCFFEDRTRIDLYPDPARTVEENAVLTEQDGDELREFIAYSAALFAATEEGYFAEGLDTLWEMIRFHGPINALRKFGLFHTMADGVGKRVDNEYLRHILNFFVKYVGSSPYDAPSVLNLLPHAQFEYGLWYVDGGMFELGKALEKLARECGVKVNLGSEIARLPTRRGSVTGADLTDGRRIEADIFVCNMEVIPACRSLLHEPEHKLHRLRKFEPACSGLVLHLGTDRRYPQLSHHNFFFSRHPRHHFQQVFHDKVLPEDPTVYVVASSRTDPSQAPEGCENIKVLPHIPYIQDRPFIDDDYPQLRSRVLTKLERMGLTDLRNHIIVEDMWTPEDIRDHYYSNKGAIYGVVSDRKLNHGFKAPKRSADYDNLYFVGGSVNPGGGMPMAALSGQQVSEFITSEQTTPDISGEL
ncbi:MAG: phytoene desaturase family protein [Candidatus Brocadiia bacterium]